MYADTWLLNQALDVNNGQGFPQLYSNLSKNSTIPDVSGGVLWSDNTNKLFYQWGGQFQTNPEKPTFYVFDTIYNTWNTTTADLSELSRVAYGAGTTVEPRAEGYYFGGWLSNQTVPGWSGPPVATNNIIKYNMTSGQFQNNSGPSDNLGRAEGALVYLPASDKGLLIYFGGVIDQGNGSTTAANMSDILIYDLNSEVWYNQTATGTVPDERGKFCAGVTWPDDQSSYNIYLYGGQGHQNGDVAFDDVYILTLPSFQWIKWYPTTPGPGRPHYDLTCNVIDGTQMLIIGGTFPLDNQCDAPNVYGTHNLNLGKNGPQNAQWDLFYPNITQYDVPSEIISVVGGSASGGATKKDPANGWDDRDLSVYFSRTPSFAARTATRPIPSSTGVGSGSSNSSSGSSNTGAIVGGVVGGIAGLALVIGFVWFCLRRRRREGVAPKKSGDVQRRKTVRAELPATSAPVEAGGTPIYRDEPRSGGDSLKYDHSGSHSPDLNGTMSTTGTTASMLHGYANSPHSPYDQSTQAGLYQDQSPQQHQYSQGYQQLPQQYQQQQQQQQSQYQQYDPSQDMMRQQHYPPPPQANQGYVSPPQESSPSPVSYEAPQSPPTAQSTPAHFYPKPLYPNRQVEGKRSPQPTHGRFIEEEDEET
ncbi:MAG: hypothetical protein Q9157_008822 [Trypethelium eluteriae]